MAEHRGPLAHGDVGEWARAPAVCDASRDPVAAQLAPALGGRGGADADLRKRLWMALRCPGRTTTRRARKSFLFRRAKGSCGALAIAVSGKAGNREEREMASSRPRVLRGQCKIRPAKRTLGRGFPAPKEAGGVQLGPVWLGPNWRTATSSPPWTSPVHPAHALLGGTPCTLQGSSHSTSGAPALLPLRRPAGPFFPPAAFRTSPFSHNNTTPFPVSSPPQFFSSSARDSFLTSSIFIPS